MSEELQVIGRSWHDWFEKAPVELTSLYPEGWVPDPLEAQRDRLLAAFPNLRLPDPVSSDVLPVGFDAFGYNVFPERLGLRYAICDGNGENYGRIIEEIIFPGLEATYFRNRLGFHNGRAGKFGSDCIRLEARGRRVIEELQTTTEYDAFIAPISYGLRWGPITFSPGFIRELALSAKELPNGSAMVCCHLIAQPGRLTDFFHLWIDCPGDEYNQPDRKPWTDCPGLGFVAEYLWFSVGPDYRANSNYGPVLTLPKSGVVQK